MTLHVWRNKKVFSLYRLEFVPTPKSKLKHCNPRRGFRTIQSTCYQNCRLKDKIFLYRTTTATKSSGTHSVIAGERQAREKLWGRELFKVSWILFMAVQEKKRHWRKYLLPNSALLYSTLYLFYDVCLKVDPMCACMWGWAKRRSVTTFKEWPIFAMIIIITLWVLYTKYPSIELYWIKVS